MTLYLRRESVDAAGRESSDRLRALRCGGACRSQLRAIRSAVSGRSGHGCRTNTRPTTQRSSFETWVRQ